MRAGVMERAKLGIIINPVAGIGGKVGLKGSDGIEVQKMAKERGAVPESPLRAMHALKELLPTIEQYDILTCPGNMGEEECCKSDLPCTVLSCKPHVPTTAEDTIEAACLMKKEGVKLILFAGGDGTARNVCHAVGLKVPVVGIPSGVKIHSAVFGMNPKLSGQLAARYMTDPTMQLRNQEVMDIDEAAYRAGQLQARLYGYMKVPYAANMVQRMKAGSVSEESVLAGIAMEIEELMEEGTYYIIGAGTTTKCIPDSFGERSTLLGVDAILNKEVVAFDLTERGILSLIEGKKAKIVISPIGGQGYLFGRGNQQLSRKVLELAGVENILVVATPQKLADLEGQPFRTDIDDVVFPKYIRVITGYHQQMVYPIV